MSTLPKSLQLVLAARAMSGKSAIVAAMVAQTKAEKCDTTTVWRDGEVIREDHRGRVFQMPSIRPIS